MSTTSPNDQDPSDPLHAQQSFVSTFSFQTRSELHSSMGDLSPSSQISAFLNPHSIQLVSARSLIDNPLAHSPGAEELGPLAASSSTSASLPSAVHWLDSDHQQHHSPPLINNVVPASFDNAITTASSPMGNLRLHETPFLPPRPRLSSRRRMNPESGLQLSFSSTSSHSSDKSAHSIRSPRLLDQGDISASKRHRASGNLTTDFLMMPSHLSSPDPHHLLADFSSSHSQPVLHLSPHLQHQFSSPSTSLSHLQHSNVHLNTPIFSPVDLFAFSASSSASSSSAAASLPYPAGTASYSRQDSFTLAPTPFAILTPASRVLFHAGMSPEAVAAAAIELGERHSSSSASSAAASSSSAYASTIPAHASPLVLKAVNHARTHSSTQSLRVEDDDADDGDIEDEDANEDHDKSEHEESRQEDDQDEYEEEEEDDDQDDDDEDFSASARSAATQSGRMTRSQTGSIPIQRRVAKSPRHTLTSSNSHSSHPKSGLVIVDLEDGSGPRNVADDFFVDANKRYQCKLCNKSSFCRKPNVIRHLQSHYNLREHKCSICGKGFNRKEAMSRHQDTVHGGHRPFKCPRCPKRFIQRHDVKNHLRTHSGERPFGCEECEAHFPTNSKLIEHVRRCHGDREHQCAFCQKTFALHSDLKRHVVVSHGAMLSVSHQSSSSSSEESYSVEKSTSHASASSSVSPSLSKPLSSSSTLAQTQPLPSSHIAKFAVSSALSSNMTLKANTTVSRASSQTMQNDASSKPVSASSAASIAFEQFISSNAAASKQQPVNPQKTHVSSSSSFLARAFLKTAQKPVSSQSSSASSSAKPSDSKQALFNQSVSSSLSHEHSRSRSDLAATSSTSMSSSHSASSSTSSSSSSAHRIIETDSSSSPTDRATSSSAASSASSSRRSSRNRPEQHLQQ